MSDLPDRFLFEVEGLDPSLLRVVRFSGQEGISELFAFEVLVASDNGELDFDSVVGKSALLTLRGDEGESRYVHGIVSRFEQGELGKKLTTYRAKLVPAAFRLEQRADCCIYQEKNVPDIVKMVLERAGLSANKDFRFSIRGSYPVRNYCVQYRESDWAFVCRLLEDEGIFYFFEFSESGHVLVIADASSAVDPISGQQKILYRAPTGALAKGEHIHRFQYSGELHTGAVALRSFDFTKPNLLPEGETSATMDTDLAIYDSMGADVEHPPAGRSKVRLEERRVFVRSGQGESACMRLTPGFSFTLDEFPRDALNQKYVLTRIEHRGFEPAMSELMGTGKDNVRYENRFEVIPESTPFRPPLLTPRPTIRGLQTAITMGPKGEEIYTDEHGRIKVQFHWDRVGKKDDKSSCWLRVGQSFAGPGFGALFLPRVGQEVLVDFLDGDPDRPLVVGTVYNGINRPPYTLPDDKTKSTLKTNTSPGGGGFNEFRFEDKKDKEEIFLHAQKDLNVEVLHDASRTIGHDEVHWTKNDRKKKIGHDETHEVGNDRKREVKRDEAVTIGRDRTMDTGRDRIESVGQNLVLSVAKSRTEDIGEDSTETTGTTKTLSVGTDYTIEVSGSENAKVGGSQTEDVKLDRTIKVGEKLVIEVGAAKVTIEKSGKVTISGGTMEVQSTGNVTLKAAGNVAVQSSGKVDVQGSGPMNIQASGPVKVKGVNVGIN